MAFGFGMGNVLGNGGGFFGQNFWQNAARGRGQQRIGYDVNPFDNRQYMLPSMALNQLQGDFSGGGIGTPAMQMPNNPNVFAHPSTVNAYNNQQAAMRGYGAAKNAMARPMAPPAFFNNGLGTAWGNVAPAQRNQFLPPLQNGRRTYRPTARVY